MGRGSRRQEGWAGGPHPPAFSSEVPGPCEETSLQALPGTTLPISVGHFQYIDPTYRSWSCIVFIGVKCTSHKTDQCSHSKWVALMTVPRTFASSRPMCALQDHSQRILPLAWKLLHDLCVCKRGCSLGTWGHSAPAVSCPTPTSQHVFRVWPCLNEGWYLTDQRLLFYYFHFSCRV